MRVCSPLDPLCEQSGCRNIGCRRAACSKDELRIVKAQRGQWARALHSAPLGVRFKATLFTTLNYVSDRFSEVKHQQVPPNLLEWVAGIAVEVDDRRTFEVYANNLTDAIGLDDGNPCVIG